MYILYLIDVDMLTRPTNLRSLDSSFSVYISEVFYM